MRYLVTGAKRGIGLEFVRQLTTRGDAVIATARDPDGTEELSALKRQHPSLVEVQACDVADDASAERLAAAVGTARWTS